MWGFLACLFCFDFWLVGLFGVVLCVVVVSLGGGLFLIAISCCRELPILFTPIFYGTAIKIQMLLA